ncbi:AP-3 complex subunit mu [Monosporozyma servazzii]
MYISFYITDSRNGLIFQYLPSNDAPSFKNLWTRIQSTCPQMVQTKMDNAEDEYTVEISGMSNTETCTNGIVGKDLEVFKYYSCSNNLYYWCLVSRSSNSTQVSHRSSMEPLILMGEIDQILMDYFDKDKITVKKIVNNYDQITLIFNCYINGGEPMTSGMYMNRVKGIIPMKSDFSKVINSTAHTIQSAVARHQYPSNGQMDYANKMFSTGGKSGSPFIQDVEAVPWRNNKIMEDKNEFYLDIQETMSLVMEKRNNSSKRKTSRQGRFELVSGKITGTFDCRSYIGGTPLVSIKLNNSGYDLGLPSLHDCVEIDQFDSKETTLAFIPPNGKFKLMGYNLNLSDNERVKNWNQLGIVSLDYMNDLGVKEDEFEITVNISSSRKVAKIRNLDIELQFALDIDKSKKTDKSHYKIRVLRSTHGRFNQMANQQRGNWVFDSGVATGTTAILRGCVESQTSDDMDFGEDESGPNNTNQDKDVFTVKRFKLNRVIIRYSHEGETLSGMSVDSIQIDSESSHTHSGLGSNPSSGSNSSTNVKAAFKGVKYLSRVEAAEMRTF